MSFGIAKMSKSKKNVVDPDDILARYGADAARWFVLSDSPPERDVEWTASGAEATSKFLGRVHRLAAETADAEDASDDALTREVHLAIRDVTLGIESFGFNAAIARLYALAATVQKAKAAPGAKRGAYRTMAQLMAPIAPHIAEEIWSLTGGDGLCAAAPWPVADESLLVSDSVTLPIQINGKRRAEITVPADMPKGEVEALALSQPAILKALDGGAPKKVIVVPGRIVNVVA